MKKFFLLLLSFVVVLELSSQNNEFKEFMQRQRAEYRQFVADRQAEYDAYRKKQNEQYAEFLRSRWEIAETHAADTIVKIKEVKPVVYEELESDSGYVEAVNNQIAVTNAVAFIPKAESSPKPIAPVQAKDDGNSKQVLLSYYGAPIRIKFPNTDTLRLRSLSEEGIAQLWKTMSEGQYDITIKSFLDARNNSKLCDWAYLDVIEQVTQKNYGKTNEAVLMQTYIMSQSGYRVRMAMSEKQLYMLVASKYDIYGLKYIKLDNTKFYIIGKSGQEKLKICSAKFDNEESVSLQMKNLPRLSSDATPMRSFTSKKGVTVKVSCNQNLLNFFEHYPKSCLNGDYTTRWAVYANTPIDNYLRETMYEQLKRIVAPLSEKDAVGLLLNWVQTAFPYKLDDEVWGEDRAFFAQETLYYPYCDCEDRSILFSRIVRDVMKLDVVLLYYPGHMATAVAFKQDVSGDYLTFGNKRYVVCDPTYINAPVGKTMPGMNNTEAKIIAL